MTIGAILKDKGGAVVSLAPTATVREAALLAERRIGAVPVVDGGEVAGIFSERDVTYCLAREGAGALDRTLAEVMTTPVQTVGAGDAVIGALSLMTRRRIRHLPVVEDGAIVGFISIRPGEVPDRPDRGRCCGDARLYPAGLTAHHRHQFADERAGEHRQPGRVGGDPDCAERHQPHQRGGPVDL